jgi:hypothetical protein
MHQKVGSSRGSADSEGKKTFSTSIGKTFFGSFRFLQVTVGCTYVNTGLKTHCLLVSLELVGKKLMTFNFVEGRYLPTLEAVTSLFCNRKKNKAVSTRQRRIGILKCFVLTSSLLFCRSKLNFCVGTYVCTECTQNACKTY